MLRERVGIEGLTRALLAARDQPPEILAGPQAGRCPLRGWLPWDGPRLRRSCGRASLGPRARGSGDGLGLLDRPGRDVHRRRRARPGGAAAPGEAAVGGPRPLRRRGAARDPRLPRPRPGRRHPGGAGGEREDGHHGGDQRAARTQGRAGGARHHQGARTAAQARLPEPAAAVRPADRAPRDALRPGDRGARAGAGGRDRRGAARRGRISPRRWRRRARRASTPAPSSSSTATATRRTRPARRRWPRRRGSRRYRSATG